MTHADGDNVHEDGSAPDEDALDDAEIEDLRSMPGTTPSGLTGEECAQFEEITREARKKWEESHSEGET